MPRIVCGAVALVALAGCGPIMSSQVADQINGMVGLSKEHVLSCMGPPTSTSSAGATEVWTYNSLGPVNSSTVLSGNQSFVVGSTSTSQEFCAINLTMQSDRVVMANYRSQGKLLAPSLPCYSVLHACVPNPGTASAQAESTQGERSKEAFAYCKELFKDPRLDFIRGVIAIDQQPTLEMQSNSKYITEIQRPAVDFLKTLKEQCRNKVAENAPRLGQLVETIDPNIYQELRMLYQKQITIGDYNMYSQSVAEKFRAAAVAAKK